MRKGKITTGTLKSDVGDVPVTIRGKTQEDNATLKLEGGDTIFEGKGTTSASGFTAKWKAQAFGALLEGEGLPVARAAP